MSRLPSVGRVLREVAARTVTAVGAGRTRQAARSLSHAPASAAGSTDARASFVFVFVVAAGALGSPFVIGAAAILLLGERMVPRVERGLTESVRGHFTFALAALALGLCGWLPAPAASPARVVLALAVVPLAYVPALLHDPDVTLRRAVARSLDLTMRARSRELAPALVLSMFLGPMVSLAAFVWQLGREWDTAPFTLRAAVLGVAAIGIACVGASGACAAVTALSRSATLEGRHLRAPSRPGTALVAFSVISLVWLAAVPAIVVSSFRAEGSESLVAAIPLGVEPAPGGALLVMRGHDGAEIGVLLHRESERWWLDLADVASVRAGLPRAATSTDDRIAMAQLQSNVWLTLVAVMLGGLAYARRDSLRRALGRANVVRVRVRPAEIEGGLAHGRGTLRAGAELALLVEGTTAHAARPLPISGLPSTEPVGGQPEWIEASVIAPKPWSGATTYRAAADAPPAGARVVVGGTESAIAQGRLDDLERLVVMALVLVALMGAAAAFAA